MNKGNRLLKIFFFLYPYVPVFVKQCKKRRIYSAEFKEEVIALVERDGLSCVQVEKDIGIGKGVVS